jgi:hypothetical protein
LRDSDAENSGHEDGESDSLLNSDGAIFHRAGRFVANAAPSERSPF